MNEHGIWRLSTTPSRVLVGKYWLAWNEEAARRYVKDVKDRVRREFDGQSWATLLDLRDLEGGVPEAEQAVAELNHWRLNNGCVRLVQVIGEHWITEIQRQRISSAQEPIPGFRHFRTESLQEGVDWLCQQGFPLTVSEAELERFPAAGTG